VCEDSSPPDTESSPPPTLLCTRPKRSSPLPSSWRDKSPSALTTSLSSLLFSHSPLDREETEKFRRREVTAIPFYEVPPSTFARHRPQRTQCFCYSSGRRGVRIVPPPRPIFGSPKLNVVGPDLLSPSPSRCFSLESFLEKL